MHVCSCVDMHATSSSSISFSLPLLLILLLLLWHKCGRETAHYMCTSHTCMHLYITQKSVWVCLRSLSCAKQPNPNSQRSPYGPWMIITHWKRSHVHTHTHTHTHTHKNTHTVFLPIGTRGTVLSESIKGLRIPDNSFQFQTVIWPTYTHTHTHTHTIPYKCTVTETDTLTYRPVKQKMDSFKVAYGPERESVCVCVCVCTVCVYFLHRIYSFVKTRLKIVFWDIFFF